MLGKRDLDVVAIGEFGLASLVARLLCVGGPGALRRELPGVDCPVEDTPLGGLGPDVHLEARADAGDVDGHTALIPAGGVWVVWHAQCGVPSGGDDSSLGRCSLVVWGSCHHGIASKADAALAADAARASAEQDVRQGTAWRRKWQASVQALAGYVASNRNGWHRHH